MKSLFYILKRNGDITIVEDGVIFIYFLTLFMADIWKESLKVQDVGILPRLLKAGLPSEG